MAGIGCSLDRIVRQSENLSTLRRNDLRRGDIVYIRTCNSMYRIRVEDNRLFTISGGWFDRQGVAPLKTTIAGCTWGSSVINVNVVAAVGLSLEFGNRVTTSPIVRIVHIRREQEN